MDYYQEGYNYADKIWNEQICKLNQATQDMAMRLMLMAEVRRYLDVGMLEAMAFAKGYSNYMLKKEKGNESIHTYEDTRA